MLNQYDLCVTNRIVDEKQCTICWNVDDNKGSHVDPKVIVWVIKNIEQKLWKKTEKEEHHTFVGIDLEFTKEINIKITIKGYIRQCFKAFIIFGVEIELFVIEENTILLNDKQADAIHHIVAKLLYVTKRARVEVDLAVFYLCTRVWCIDKDDWEKLRQFLR